MGTVLEMNLRLAILLICTAGLSACGLPVIKSAVPLITAAAGGVVQPATPTTAPPAPDAEQIWLTLKSRGIKFPMAQIASRDGVKIFAAADGAQVFLKNGILVGTRGFGRDLMSADSASLADLTGGVEHHRDFYDMDGTDTMIRHSYTCTIDPVDPTNANAGIVEACASDIGTIHNEYWINAGKSVVKSKQWISQGVGYAIVEPKTD